MRDYEMVWPLKVREIHNHHMDSTIWNDFAFHDDDIIVATYQKTGTTLTQQIVGQLIFDGRPDLSIAELSPWLDFRAESKEEKFRRLEQQKHRRFIKTHLPADALVFSPKAKYLYIARDGRDVLWSLHHHHANANDAWYRALNDTPGLVGLPMPKADPDIRSYFLRWLEKDGYPFWPFWENIRTWWNLRNLTNVLLVHYNSLRQDTDSTICRIAEFLNIPIDETKLSKVKEFSSFAFMKKNAELAAPARGELFHGGAATFFNKGANGRWRDVLTANDIAVYEARARYELGEDCARWLAEGKA